MMLKFLFNYPALLRELIYLRAHCAKLEKEAMAKPYSPDWAAYKHGKEAGFREAFDITKNRHIESIQLSNDNLKSLLSRM